MVDDPYDYGAIAAANSLSDIYAMGAEPFLALNIAAMPPDLPLEVTGEIFRGAAEKVRQAGAAIAGGHTIQDKEPKFGLVVLGFVHPARLLTKSGLRPGDRLVLTKPLGMGLLTTALKQGKALEEDIAEGIRWMSTLNRAAGKLAQEFELRGGTDVTGFSLLGHAYEMAEASALKLRFHYQAVPFLCGTPRYVKEWTFPGGTANNRLHYGSFVQFASHLDEAAQMLLFDAQTSGGLLLGVPPHKLAAFLARAREIDQPAWEVGEVLEGRAGVEVF